MKSPAFSFKGTFPKVFKSLLISVAAIFAASLILHILKMIYPEADFTQVQAAIVTGASGWMINLIRVYVLEQK